MEKCSNVANAKVSIMQMLCVNQVLSAIIASSNCPIMENTVSKLVLSTDDSTLKLLEVLLKGLTSLIGLCMRL